MLQLRGILREYYPALLAAFADNKRGGLLRPEARAPLAPPPTPRSAARLTRPRVRAVLKRAGPHRGLDTEAERLHAVLRADYLHQPTLVEDAFARQTAALLRALDTACANATDLAAAAEERFAEHPDAEIITSLPGPRRLTGARVLAEIGGDRTRFTDARALKAYAGSAPVTRASGRSRAVMHRRVKNHPSSVGVGETSTRRDGRGRRGERALCHATAGCEHVWRQVHVLTRRPPRADGVNLRFMARGETRVGSC